MGKMPNIITKLLDIQVLLGMITPSQLKEGLTWQTIGKVLYNEKGKEKGLDLFIEASRGVKDEKECSLFWSSLSSSTYTIKTLAWIARATNKDIYNIWHNSIITENLNKIMLDGSKVNISQLIYVFYWLDYICPDLRLIRSEWWQYREGTHHYQEVDRVIVRFEFFSKIANYLTSVMEQKWEDSAVSVKILTLLKNLKRDDFSDTIFSHCANIFYDKSFEGDKNCNLSAWPNCVVDVSTGKVVIRNGLPEDYLTKCGAIKYNTHLSFQSPCVLQLLEYLDQLFPNPIMLATFLNDITSYLKKGNNEAVIRVWQSFGGFNSISTLLAILREWWGNSVSENCNLGKWSGMRPAEEAHLYFSVEGEEDISKLRREFKKKVSWNTPKDKVIFHLCELPKDYDKTFSILEFRSQWKVNAPATKEEQIRKSIFPANPHFERYHTVLAEAMFWLAVQLYSFHII